MRVRALAAALLAGTLLLTPLEARRHAPKVPKHTAIAHPKSPKAKRYKPRKVKPSESERFRGHRPKPPKVPRHKHA